MRMRATKNLEVSFEKLFDAREELKSRLDKQRAENFGVNEIWNRRLRKVEECNVKAAEFLGFLAANPPVVKGSKLYKGYIESLRGIVNHSEDLKEKAVKYYENTFADVSSNI